VSIGQRTCKGTRLLRCTKACERERGGVSPPCSQQTRLQRPVHSIRHGHRARTKAGGASPPWRSVNAVAREMRLLPRTNACAQERGGVSPPVVATTRLQRRSPTRRPGVSRAIAVAPLQVRQRDARRAHARRSWLQARCRAAIVCVGVTSLFPQRTAGLRPPLLLRVRLCIAKVAIPSAGERTGNKSGGRNPPCRTCQARTWNTHSVASYRHANEERGA